MMKDKCLSKERCVTHPHLKSYVSYCLHKSAAKAREILTQELAPWGIIPPQLGMLKILAVEGALSQVNLGDEMLIDKATMVKLIDGLEEKGFIERQAPTTGDRRIKMVRITTKGLKALEKMSKARQKAEDVFLKPLSAAEKAALKKILPKLVGS